MDCGYINYLIIVRKNALTDSSVICVYSLPVVINQGDDYKYE
jgi:hypothetical protein